MGYGLIQTVYGTGVNGDALAVNTWTNLLFSEIIDTTGQIVVNGDGSFTITNASYPVGVRFDCSLVMASPATSGALSGKFALLNAAGSFLAYSTPIRVQGTSTNRINQVASLQFRIDMADATTFKIQARSNIATNLGVAATSGGVNEIYANVVIETET